MEAMLTHGVCERWEGVLPSSRRVLEGAARWARLSGNKEREAIAAAELGRTLVEMGEWRRDGSRGRTPCSRRLPPVHAAAELTAQLLLAESYLHEGKGAEARYHAAQARELHAYLGQEAAQAEGDLDLGEAQALLMQTDEALKSLADAAAVAWNASAHVYWCCARTVTRRKWESISPRRCCCGRPLRSIRRCYRGRPGKLPV